MKTTIITELEKRLERVSMLIQKRLKETEDSFQEAELVANELGYTFCRQTGKLLKQ